MATCISTEWFVGEDPSWTLSTVDADTGDPADPTTLTFAQTVPAGTTTVYTYGVDDEIVKLSTGEFRFTGPPVAAVTAGSDTGKVVATTVAAGETEIVVAYYRAVTP